MNSASSLRSLLSQSSLPSNEAKILLAHVLEKHYQLPRSALLSRDDMTLNPSALEEWVSLEARRINGEPIAYLLGKKDFHGIELHVAPGVLIPRPETELLVDIALAEIQQKIDQDQVRVLDLGTGSGAIALAVANLAHQVLIKATDVSSDALTIAKLNAVALNLESRVQFSQGSWYEALNGSDIKEFDVILSNPPYIAAQDPHLSQGDLRFEPNSALTDQSTGLTCLEIIISKANQYLKPGGLIAVEHGFDQSSAVVQLMKIAGLQNIEVHLDLAGHSRVTSGRKSNPQ